MVEDDYMGVDGWNDGVLCTCYDKLQLVRHIFFLRC